MNNNKIYLSLIIPLYNEVENLDGLFKELKVVMPQLGVSWEVLFVDDGSVDGTWNKLLSEASDWSAGSVRLIRLARNYGQTTALAAGIETARGELIATMDGDLQNDPADIPKLLAEIDKGADVVSGWRRRRKDSFIRRRVPSWLGNKLISWQAGVKLHDFGCSLKVYKSEYIKSARLYGEMHRVLPALLAWMGANIVEIEVNHRPRKAGKSKYNLSRVFAVILDLISIKFFSSYATRPTHIIGMWGILSIILGMISGIILIYMKYQMHFNMTGNPFLVLSVMLTIVGVQLIALGLLGEINVRAYFEIQGKASYRIKETREL